MTPLGLRSILRFQHNEQNLQQAFVSKAFLPIVLELSVIVLEQYPLPAPAPLTCCRNAAVQHPWVSGLSRWP
jgi:integral membrane sensor domain MASE1